MVDDRYREKPERIVFGETAWCYACHGTGKKSGERSKPCPRCEGLGIIPNKGPIQAQKKP